MLVYCQSVWQSINPSVCQSIGILVYLLVSVQLYQSGRLLAHRSINKSIHQSGVYLSINSVCLFVYLTFCRSVLHQSCNIKQLETSIMHVQDVLKVIDNTFYDYLYT